MNYSSREKKNINVVTVFDDIFLSGLISQFSADLYYWLDHVLVKKVIAGS